MDSSAAGSKPRQKENNQSYVPEAEPPTEGRDQQFARVECDSAVSQSSRTDSGRRQCVSSRTKLSGTTVQRSRSSNSAQGFQLGEGRPRSRQSKVKPAHVTAPFKTQPNMPVPKRQSKNPTPRLLDDRSKKSANNMAPTQTRGRKPLPPINAGSVKYGAASDVASKDSGKTQSAERFPTAEDLDNGVCNDGVMCQKDSIVDEIAANLSELPLSGKSGTGDTKLNPRPSQQTDIVRPLSKPECNDCFTLQRNGYVSIHMYNN